MIIVEHETVGNYVAVLVEYQTKPNTYKVTVSNPRTNWAKSSNITKQDVAYQNYSKALEIMYNRYMKGH